MYQATIAGRETIKGRVTITGRNIILDRDTIVGQDTITDRDTIMVEVSGSDRDGVRGGVIRTIPIHTIHTIRHHLSSTNSSSRYM